MNDDLSPTSGHNDKIPDLDVMFDENGLPAGRIGDEVWPGMLLEIEESLEAEGWDQPARLIGVVNPVNTEAQLGADKVELARLSFDRAVRSDNPDWGAGADPTGMVLAVVQLGDVLGHPVETLWGFEAPGWVSALVLATEGWIVEPERDDNGDPLPDPFEHLPNSQHPRRLEVRSLHMLTRSGNQYMASRVRGGEPSTFGRFEGLVVDVMRRAFGLPTPAPDTTTGDLLGRMALSTSFRSLLPLLSELPDADQSLRLRFGLPPQVDSHPAVVEMRRQLNEVPPQDRLESLVAMHSRLFIQGVGLLCWVASREGRLIDKPLRKWLRQVTFEPVTIAEEHLQALVEAGTAVSELSFVDLVSVKKFQDMLPEEVRDAPPGWADEGLLARRLCWRQWPSQPNQLAQIREVFGEIPQGIEELLVAMGWYSDKSSPNVQGSYSPEE